VILDNIKSSMCCLPIVVAAWLCSFINVSDGETRQKALFMLQHLKTPLSTESPVQYYNERFDSVLCNCDVITMKGLAVYCVIAMSLHKRFNNITL